MNKLADLPQVSLDPDDYEDVDIDDPDNPELTEEDFARMRPARELLGDAFVDAWEAVRKAGTLCAVPVHDVELTLPAEVVDHYREAAGEDWKQRVRADLEELVRARKAS